MLPRQGGKSTIEYVKKKEEEFSADLDFIKKKNPAAALLKMKTHVEEQTTYQTPAQP